MYFNVFRLIIMKGSNEVIYTNPMSRYADLMTMEELIQFFRIPEVSTAKTYHNVIKNLIRFRDLPRVCIWNNDL